MTGSADAEPDLGRYADAIDWLRERARADSDVVAAWIGGSAATGGFDEWSDLDVEVLCTPGSSPRVHEALLGSMPHSVGTVWRLPRGTWPDGRQSFVTLDADGGALAPPTRLLDLHVHDDTPAARHVDERRHGRILLVHDPHDVVRQRHEDEADLVRRRVLELEQIRQRRDVAGWLVQRALARRQQAEAAALHLRVGVAPLVTLLRNEACPWRFDYGLRYLRSDLPADQVDRLEALLPGAGPSAAIAARCFGWQDALLAAPPLRGTALPEGTVVGLAVPAGATVEALWAKLPTGLETWLGEVHGAAGPGETLAVRHVDGTSSAVRFTLDEAVLLVEHTGLTGPGDSAAYAAGWQRHTDLLEARLTGASPSPADHRDGYEALQARYAAVPRTSRSTMGEVPRRA